MLKRIFIPFLLAFFGLGTATMAQDVSVDEYIIDTKMAHASVNFRIQHLGFSWLVGRFDEFSGRFGFDPDNVENSWVEVVVNTQSVNSNHDLRDSHLRGEKYLSTDSYPEARFQSTHIEANGDGNAIVYGDLTLRGVTKEIAIMAELIGGGDDPWGNSRYGFMGTTSLTLADFGITANLGPKSRQVELELHIEGIKE